MMNTQSIVRTFIDKLYAVCDYYMNGKPTRNSRHLYNIYKYYSYITVDDFRDLVVDVNKRAIRSLSGGIPSGRRHMLDKLFPLWSL